MEGDLDVYTKTVLTVIAVALSVIAIRDVGDVISPAFAQRITQVEICGQEVNPNAPSAVSCAEMLTDHDGIRRLLVTR